MEQIQRLIKEANNKFKTADHLVYVTYGLLKDQRLMLAVIQNLHTASLNAIAALLYYEKIYKRIDVLPLEVNSRIKLFEDNLSKVYKLNKEVINVVKELRILVNEHRESPLEFARKEKLIICNDDYSKINMVDINKLKNYVINIRELIEVVNKLKNV